MPHAPTIKNIRLRESSAVRRFDCLVFLGCRVLFDRPRFFTRRTVCFIGGCG
jgi:hypothetical protein